MKNVTTKVFSIVSSAKAYANALAVRAKKDMASDKKGQGILEYGVLFIVVGLGLVLAVQGLKDKISAQLTKAGDMVTQLSPANK